MPQRKPPQSEAGPAKKKPPQKAVISVHPALVVRVKKLHPAKQVIRNHGTDND